jgi:hypothetical protein
MTPTHLFLSGMLAATLLHRAALLLVLRRIRRERESWQQFQRERMWRPDRLQSIRRRGSNPPPSGRKPAPPAGPPPPGRRSVGPKAP